MARRVCKPIPGGISLLPDGNSSGHPRIKKSAETEAEKTVVSMLERVGHWGFGESGFNQSLAVDVQLTPDTTNWNHCTYQLFVKAAITLTQRDPSQHRFLHDNFRVGKPGNGTASSKGVNWEILSKAPPFPPFKVDHPRAGTPDGEGFELDASFTKDVYPTQAITRNIFPVSPTLVRIWDAPGINRLWEAWSFSNTAVNYLADFKLVVTGTDLASVSFYYHVLQQHSPAFSVFGIGNYGRTTPGRGLP